MLRILHLTGSPESEFYADLSRLYAADCLRSTADHERYEFVIADVSPDGRWRFPNGLDDASLTSATPVPVSEAIAHIVASDIDLVVPQLFCRSGMTAYRALFDVLRIPYVGNTPDVMALGADKARAKAVVAAAGVAVPQGQVVTAGERVTVARPAVVKPVDADNSLGVALVRDADRFGPAVEQALRHSTRVLVEEYVELGREVRCGIVERDGELIGLPLEEYRVDPETKPIRGHDDKIRRNGDGLGLVAKDAAHAWIVDVDDPLTAVVWEVAKQCHRALGCRHYSLFDFRIDAAGRPWFLEASLYNSFARQSVLAVMAAAAGTGIGELFADAVALALPATAALPAVAERCDPDDDGRPDPSQH